MSLSRGQYDVYLELMRELDAFRSQYIARHQVEHLDREDPDVRRLMEAMAFFAARAQYAGQNYLGAMRRSLMYEFFPYLASPIPALGLLQAVPTAKMSEAVHLPAGTVLAANLGATDRIGVMTTLDDLTILPIEIYRFDQVPMPNNGVRLQLRFRGPYARNDELETLSLYVNQLSDYASSARVLNLLEKHLIEARVVYTDGEDVLIDPEKGERLDIDFEQASRLKSHEGRHPIERTRWLLHQPEQGLFVNLKFPKTPRNWRTFTVIFDIADWPERYRVSRDTFLPFVVPIGNIVRDYAEPVEYDGTTETISIRHPDTKERYEMHSLLGVYRVNEGVMEPMQSGTVATGSGTYRVVDDGRGQFETHKRIALDLPQAFDQSVTVSVDAHWHQTWLSEYVNEKFEYSLYRSASAGLRWAPVGELRPLCRPASLQQDDKYLQLFSLQNKPKLNHRDVIALLNALGPVGERAFGSIRSQWRGTRCEQVPDPESAGKLKTQFVFQFSGLPPELAPVAELWVHYLSRILNVWLAGTKVSGVAEYAQ